MRARALLERHRAAERRRVARLVGRLSAAGSRPHAARSAAHPWLLPCCALAGGLLLGLFAGSVWGAVRRSLPALLRTTGRWLRLGLTFTVSRLLEAARAPEPAVAPAAAGQMPSRAAS